MLEMNRRCASISFKPKDMVKPLDGIQPLVAFQDELQFALTDSPRSMRLFDLAVESIKVRAIFAGASFQSEKGPCDILSNEYLVTQGIDPKTNQKVGYVRINFQQVMKLINQPSSPASEPTPNQK